MAASLRIALFYHSLISDWNNGHVHFLRGVVSELLSRGHEVRVYEPADGWSRANLLAEHGEAAAQGSRRAYPQLTTTTYRLDAGCRRRGTHLPHAANREIHVATSSSGSHSCYPFADVDWCPDEVLDLDRVLDGVDLVVVHEWNDPELVRRIGAHRAQLGSGTGLGLVVLFHDTHHRAVTDPEAMARFDLQHYDGVLAFGRVLRDLYLERGWAARAWVWHEAADVRVFRPLPSERRSGLVWIGNWGDEERSAELMEFAFAPVRDLGIDATVYGVRYPEHALFALWEAGIRYEGWLPNYEVPAVFARHSVTVHVPRRPYVRALPGIPTIRVFEALACGIPLVCAPWEDVEGLFSPGDDYLVARDGAEMRELLQAVLADGGLAKELAAHGLRTILARHTCAHRVDELLAIYGELAGRRDEVGWRP